MGLFENDTTIEVSITKLERLIKAEVRLEILTKAIEQEQYITTNEIKRILGMEVMDNVAE